MKFGEDRLCRIAHGAMREAENPFALFRSDPRAVSLGPSRRFSYSASALKQA